MRGSRWVALVTLAAGLSCGDSGGPVNSVTRFIAKVTALDTSVVAVLVQGAPPGGGMGPTAVVAAPANVINGGSGQVRITAADSFGIVIVYVAGYPDYYALSLPDGDSTDVLITISPALQDASFHWRFAVGADIQSLGAYTDVPVDVIQVGSGDVQVSVSWDVDSDVDLHLVEPGAMGEEIYYANATSASGGELDLDSNSGCNLDQVRNENITYPASAPPSGTYTVRVDYWDNCSVGQTNYVVTVRVNGQATRVFTGSFTGTGDQGGAGSGTTITTFSY